ncbi:unnamed protein product [Lathyrus oleraceus]
MLIIFGFNEKWKTWMRASVFVGNLVVLINECPTQEIDIETGLNQGDHLAHFLFLLVAKGLSDLVARADEIGLYYGFRVKMFDLVVFHLQYVKYTLLMVVPIFENPWSIKAILRGFDLTSEIRLNFFKSSFIEVNMDPVF